MTPGRGTQPTSSPPGKRWPAAGVILIALAAYANTLPGDFVFDDQELIEKDAGLRDFDLRRIFLSDYWGPRRASNVYRPVVLLTYALNFRCGDAAWGFHLVNVLLNAAVALLSYWVLVQLVGDQLVAFLCASLYALLPIHVEAVANIVGRAELLAAAATFAAWLIVLKDPSPTGARAWRQTVGVGMLTFVGMLAKENSVVILPLLLVTAAIRRQTLPWGAFLGAAIAIGANLLVRRVGVDATDLGASLIDNPLAHVEPLTRGVNALGLLGVYAFKTVAPFHLSADYSYNQIPVKPLGSALTWFSAGTVVLGAGATITLAWRRLPLLALATTFFLIAFLPTSNVLFPIGTIFAERLAFLPSFAYPLLLAAVTTKFLERQPTRRRPIVCTVLALLCLLYGGRSIVRNEDWSTRQTLKARIALDAPNSTRSHSIAAEAHMLKAEEHRLSSGPESQQAQAAFALATQKLKRALEIYPNNTRSLAKLGQLHLDFGHPDEALKYLNSSHDAMRKTKTPVPEALIFRAQALVMLGRPEEAQNDLTEYFAYTRRTSYPVHFTAHQFLGMALAAQGRLEAALREFTAAVDLRPDLPEIWRNRGYCRSLLGQFDAAITDYQVGADVCRRLGVFYAPPPRESVWLFYRLIANAHRETGNEGAAQKFEAEAAQMQSAHTAR